jgi:hypothetical protein
MFYLNTLYISRRPDDVLTTGIRYTYVASTVVTSDLLVHSVGIHEHCIVAEILVFGRETGFPPKHCCGGFMYKSPDELKQT